MNIIEKIETGSTSDDSKALADAGAPSFTVVWAHRQTAGRGRHDRKWISTEGNVLWSIILRPESGWHRFSDIVYVNALAVWEAISTVCGSHAGLTLKWPNDVLLNGKKISGSLLESGGQWQNGAPGWIVIGTGINVNSHPESLDLRYPASDLHAAGFPHVTREQIVQRLTDSLKTQITLWAQNGFADVKARYLTKAFNLGQEIRVGLGTDKATYKTGIYEGINDDGFLLLNISGRLEKLTSAEVVLSSPSTSA